MYSYRHLTGQKLQGHDIDRRFEFARLMHRLITADEDIDVNDIFFTGECSVRIGDGEFDPYEHITEHRRQGKIVSIFVGIHSKAGVIGPYYTDEIVDDADSRQTLTASRYIKLLRDEVLPELESELSPKEYEQVWFMQDGALAHTANTTIAFLSQKFGDRLIAKGARIGWPPYSPDFNPLDYWYWSLMKSFVNRYDPASTDEMKLVIAEVYNLIDVGS